MKSGGLALQKLLAVWFLKYRNLRLRVHLMKFHLLLKPFYVVYELTKSEIRACLLDFKNGYIIKCKAGGVVGTVLMKVP